MNESSIDPDAYPDDVPDPGPGSVPPWGPMCGRCHAFVDTLYPSPCTEDPLAADSAMLGQYHCPDCGAMLVAGLPHPQVCLSCRERRTPGFATPISTHP